MPSNNDVVSTSTSAPSNPMVTGSLNKLLGQFDSAIDQGAPAQFGKPLYPGVGPTTQQGWTSALTAAQNPMFKTGLNSATTNLTNLMRTGGGLTQGQHSAMGTTAGLGKLFGELGDNNGLAPQQQAAASSLGDISMGFDRIWHGAQNPGLTEQRLAPTAGGAYLKGANPYFESNLLRAKDAAGAAVNSGIGASGRYGSGIHVNQLGTTIGNLENSARGAQYETERDRQLQALNAIGGERQQGIANQFGALQGRQSIADQQAGIGQQGANNQFGALQGQGNTASQAFGMGQQGVNNIFSGGNALGGLYQSSLLPSATQSAVGGQQDADAQAKLLAQSQLFNGQQNNQLDWLSKLSSIFSAQAPYGGTQATETKPGTPLWQTLLGGGVGLLGAFG